MKLQIGTGGNKLEGWVNTDLKGWNRLDASKPWKYKDNSIDFIFSEHVFEHLDLQGQINYLKESYRCLKPGGVSRITMPDADFLVTLIDYPDSNRPYVQWFCNKFLDGTCEPGVDSIRVVNHYFKAWGHQLIHSNYSFYMLLGEYWDGSEAECNIHESKHPELRNLEQHHRHTPLEFYKMESMVFELTK